MLVAMTITGLHSLLEECQCVVWRSKRFARLGAVRVLLPSNWLKTAILCNCAPMTQKPKATHRSSGMAYLGSIKSQLLLLVRSYTLVHKPVDQGAAAVHSIAVLCPVTTWYGSDCQGQTDVNNAAAGH